MDLDRPFQLHPQVALRPESFGALAYHFGNRRLSFLKSRLLFDAVLQLDQAPDPIAACRAVGVDEEMLPQYKQALETLARREMIVPRGTS